MNALMESAKVLDFQAYLDRKTHADAPRAERSLCREKLFVQVILCDETPELVGRTWSCRTVRANAGHVEFLCDKHLPEGALVDLWIDLAHRPGKFYLSGRVRWTRATEEERILIGVELEDGAATDFGAWCDLHD